MSHIISLPMGKPPGVGVCIEVSTPTAYLTTLQLHNYSSHIYSQHRVSRVIGATRLVAFKQRAREVLVSVTSPYPGSLQQAIIMYVKKPYRNMIAYDGAITRLQTIILWEVQVGLHVARTSLTFTRHLW